MNSLYWLKDVFLLKVSLFRKSDLRAVDSPIKRSDEFDLFAVKSKKANKINSSVHFLGEVSIT